MSIRELQNYTKVSKYARYLDDLKRREVWPETVDRYKAMLLEKYPHRSAEIGRVCESVYVDEVMPSMRALQFGGAPVCQHNARVYNCCSVTTQFITRHGVKSFKDFQDGDHTVVLTHAGQWKNAIVRYYGSGDLYKATFRRRGGQDQCVWVTANHRWLLTSGETTTEGLDADHVVAPAPAVFSFDYHEALPDERLAWAYGYVYGDGTRVKNGKGEYAYSMVRLCGEDKARFLERFVELGFSHSEPPSCGGDAVVYTGHYLKRPIDPHFDEHRLVVAFVRGYLDADGEKNGDTFSSIQASGTEQCDFVRRVFPAVGLYVLSEKDYTGQETNFGVRPYTIRFRLSAGFSPNTAYRPVSVDWDNPVRGETWCLEVEDDHSFVLPNGLVTGNCTGSYCDRLSFFGEGFYLLLAGSGVGLSVQDRNIRHLPGFSQKRLAGVSLPTKTHRVRDSIEGWADCSHVLASSWFAEPVRGFEEYADCDVEFDFSDVRRKGSKLSFGIGRAPGPKPLRAAVERNTRLLKRAVAEGLTGFNSLYAYDFFMHWADAVISGGVRRSACIVLFDLWDRAMMLAKTGDWRQANPQRARSNNSVVLLRDETEYGQFAEIFEATKQFGEPGFYWADHPDALCNPCCEIGFWAKLRLAHSDPDYRRLLDAYQGPVEKDGDAVVISGWQMCNLSNVICKTVRSEAEFYERCDKAARLGTWQAGFNRFPYLGGVTDRIVQREALIGVGLMGIMHQPDLLLRPEVLRNGAEVVKAANADEAPRVGVNLAARNCCEKPDGNSAAAMGSFSGAGLGKFPRGFRIVQANHLEAPYQHFKSVNPEACEPSKWSANGTDDCIRFCVEFEGLMEDDVSAVQYLEYIRLIQENWVAAGRRPELCTQPWLMHNVSNTVRVRDHEWGDVAQQIYRHRNSYAGVSLLSVYGDRDYAQAPFTTVYTPEEQEAAYGEAAVAETVHMLRWAGMSPTAFTDLWDACDYVLGLWGDRPVEQADRDWAVAFDSFAARFFGGDRRKATYCLKDAHNWKLWQKLKAAYRPVDYAQMVEKTSTVDLAGEVACSGGACEVSF